MANILSGFELEAAVRIILAVIVGGIIGTERSHHGSAAGLRTHILVCVGAALTSLTGLYVNYIMGMGGDSLRLSAQVISGIGFLGTGMIVVKNSNVITGLTTAAGMWATAAIGIALGCGFYTGALMATVACVITTALLSRVERRSKRSTHNVYAEIGDVSRVGIIADLIRKEQGSDVLVETVAAKSGLPGHIGLIVTLSNSRSITEIRKAVENIDGVVFAVAE
ncbi:MAG: MgtC/SapB family protein [Clostridia bacterium]|nr:MgtC/SapB family protein [Clostridia bacterium]